MNRCALAAVLLLNPITLTGTTIAVVVGESSITIGTDSTREVTSTVGERGEMPACKVNLVDKYVFLKSGRVGDSEVGFDIQQLAELSANGTDTIERVTVNLQRAVVEHLPRVVENGRVKTPTKCGLWAAGKAPVVSYALAIIESGVAKTDFCEFKLQPTGKILPDCRSMSGKYFVFGKSDNYRRWRDRNPFAAEELAASNPLKFVRLAVELELAASQLLDNGDVGPPITRATLDAAGLHYEDRGACQDSY